MLEETGIKFTADIKDFNRKADTVERTAKNLSKKSLKVKIDLDIQSYKTELTKLTIGIEKGLGTPNVLKKVDLLKKGLKDLQREKVKIDIKKSGLDKIIKLRKDALKLQNQLKKTSKGYNNLGRAGKKSLEGLVQSNKAMIKSIDKGETSYGKLQKQIDKTNSSFQKIQKTANGRGMQVHFSTILKGVAAYKAIELGISTVRVATIGAIEKAVEYEAAFVKVKKTLSDKALLGQVKQEILELTKIIPLSVVELAKLAEIVSQGGIDAKNVKDVTDVIARFGSSTNVAGEEAAQGLIRSKNAMNLTEEAISNLASSIVYLGNNTASNEGQILDYTRRLGGLRSQANFTAADLTAVGATLASLGVRADAGSTAFSAFVGKITKSIALGTSNVAKYAGLAGQSTEDFLESWDKNTMKTTIRLLDGINKQGKKGLVVFDDLTGTNVARNLVNLKLTASTEDLTKNVEASNIAYNENVALYEESNLAFGTMESRLKRLKTSFDNLLAVSGEQLFPTLEAGMSTLADSMNGIRTILEGLNVAIQNLHVVSSSVKNLGSITDRARNQKNLERKWVKSNKAPTRYSLGLGFFDDLEGSKEMYDYQQKKAKAFEKIEFEVNLKYSDNKGLKDFDKIIKKNKETWDALFTNETEEAKKNAKTKEELEKELLNKKLDANELYYKKLKVLSDKSSKEYNRVRIQELKDRTLILKGQEPSYVTKIKTDKQDLVNSKYISDAEDKRLEQLEKKNRAIATLSKASSDYSLLEIQNNDKILTSISNLNLEYKEYSKQISELEEEKKTASKSGVENLNSQIKIIKELQSLTSQQIDIQNLSGSEDYDISIKQKNDRKKYYEQKARIEEQYGNTRKSDLLTKAAEKLEGEIMFLEKEKYLKIDQSNILIEIKKKEKEAILKEKQDEVDKLAGIERKATQKIQFQREFEQSFLGGNEFSAYRQALTKGRGVTTDEVVASPTQEKGVTNNFGDVNITDDTAFESFKRELDLI